jgi:hypothetical protein
VVDFTKKEIVTNPTYDVMWSNPLQTVNAPWTASNLVPGQKNTLTGFVQDAYLNDYAFDSQHHLFQTKGVAFDPNSNAVQIVKFESMESFLFYATLFLFSDTKKRKKDKIEDPAIGISLHMLPNLTRRY